jgi:MFS superfamily sulfate permease-like transporter
MFSVRPALWFLVAGVFFLLAGVVRLGKRA